jgi:hypothetical protein
VLLLGAHTVGHVHPDRSGFGFDEFHIDHQLFLDDGEYRFEKIEPDVTVNAWDETPAHFDNYYYEHLNQVCYCHDDDFASFLTTLFFEIPVLTTP